MNTHLTIKTLPKYIKAFGNLINSGAKEGFEIEKRDLPLEYSRMFGFDSYEDLELFLFSNSLFYNQLTDEEIIKYANQSESFSRLALESERVSIGSIENPTEKLVMLAIELDIESILSLKELKNEFIELAFTDSIMKKFYIDKNGFLNEALFIDKILKPIIQRAEEECLIISEENFLLLLDASPSFFNKIPKEYWTYDIRLKAVSMEARNIIDLLKHEEDIGIRVNREEKIAAINCNPLIIGILEQDEELVELAFKLDKKSFREFEQRFQTNEKAKICIDKITPLIIRSMKKQNEEIIQYALDKDDNSAAFVTPHFRKKLGLDKAYNIQSGYAIKLTKPRG